MFTDLGTQLASAVTAGTAAGIAAGGGGLHVVEDEINSVIKTLQTELGELEESKFPSNGAIATVSFGLGPEATDIAGHHTRAHGVVVDTLKGLIKDLEAFQEAIREARGLVAKSDAAAEEDLRVLVTRTEGLDLGVNGLAQAQVNHRNDTPTNEDT